MNRFITLLIPVLIVLAGCGAGPGGSGAGEITSDEAIARLDSVMALRPRLAAQKRRAIDSLWILSRGAVSPRERFDVLEKLFGQYSSYSMDSMLLVARMCKAEAEANLGDSLYWRAVIMESEGLKGQGQYFTGAVASQGNAAAVAEGLPAVADAALYLHILFPFRLCPLA